MSGSKSVTPFASGQDIQHQWQEFVSEIERNKNIKSSVNSLIERLTEMAQRALATQDTALQNQYFNTVYKNANQLADSVLQGTAVERAA